MPQSTSSEAGDAPTTEDADEGATDPTATSIATSTSTADTGTTTKGDATGESTRADDGTSSGDEGPPELGPFGPPELLPGVESDESDDDPTLRADLLEIYFASLRDGGEGSEDIWRAERDSIADDFGMPQPVAVLNDVGQDGWPELSHDGLVLTFASDRDEGPGGFDIWLSIRGRVDDDFGAPTLASDLSTPEDEASAVFSADMLEAFVCSPLLQPADLYVATRPAVGAQFGMTALLSAANSGGRDCVPFIDAGGTRILFASDRDGTAGGMDVWTAVRDGPDAGGAFSEPERVEALSSPFDDDDPWWAPDGSALYFASARDGGDLDIWVAYRE